VCASVAQQDVWAFGVLVFEVMGRGAKPYAEIVTLAEVAERIKAGHTLLCPDSCRPEVYQQVMLPCWRAIAKERPGFRQLCDVLVRLGATPSENADQADSAQKEAFVEETQSDLEWAAGLALEKRPLLGISVFHITKLAPRVVAAVAAPWRDSRGSMVEPPSAATIAHTVQVLAKPVGAKIACPRDGQLGCAYVDTLSKRDDVGMATALLSCESMPCVALPALAPCPVP
jgi:hypothetical protein